MLRRYSWRVSESCVSDNDLNEGLASIDISFSDENSLADKSAWAEVQATATSGSEADQDDTDELLQMFLPHRAIATRHHRDKSCTSESSSGFSSPQAVPQASESISSKRSYLSEPETYLVSNQEAQPSRHRCDVSDCKHRHLYRNRIDVPPRSKKPSKRPTAKQQLTVQSEPAPTRPHVRIKKAIPFERWAIEKDNLKRARQRTALEKQRHREKIEAEKESDERRRLQRAEEAFDLWLSVKADQEQREGQKESGHAQSEQGLKRRNSEQSQEAFQAWCKEAEAMRKELDREARQQQHEKLRLETEKKKQADAAFQEWMREIKYRPQSESFKQRTPWIGPCEKPPNKSRETKEARKTKTKSQRPGSSARSKKSEKQLYTWGPSPPLLWKDHAEQSSR